MKRRVVVECTCGSYPNHVTPCCDFFKKMLNDCYVRLSYKKRYNLYGIAFVGEDNLQGIYFCPWCGARLPEWIEGPGLKKIRPPKPKGKRGN
jgi:hypothetical protein